MERELKERIRQPKISYSNGIQTRGRTANNVITATGFSGELSKDFGHQTTESYCKFWVHIKKHPFSPNTLSSLIFLTTNHKPAGKVQIKTWRSKKNDTHVVGWCSETDAMIGMWILAYLGGKNIQNLRHKDLPICSVIYDTVTLI